MAPCAAIYATRRDISSLKERLLEEVADPDYWPMLSCFVYGECPKQIFDDAMKVYLHTDEARRLHNALIRAIVYNAHFAMRPPPGVALPAAAAPTVVAEPEPLARPVSPTTAADLHHLPSVAQLAGRAAALLAEKKMTADAEVAPALFGFLRRFVLRVLGASCARLATDAEGRGPRVLSSRNLADAVTCDANLRSVVSPTLLHKFSMFGELSG
jgi:hypothetical protein